MTTLYVDNIAPNLQSRVSVPGHVIQVVQGNHSSEETTVSSSFSDTSLSATITPISTSSKILVTCSTPVRIDSGHTAVGEFAIYRGTSASGTQIGSKRLFANGDELKTSFSFEILDSPSTTSAQVYTLAFRMSAASGGTLRVHTDSRASTLTLMEIAG